MTPLDGTHIAADDLHLLALAEVDASAAERAHLAACAECPGEYLALRQVVQLGRAVGDDSLLTPPAGVWAGIQVELGLSNAVHTPPPFTKTAAATDAAAPPQAPASPVADPAAAGPTAEVSVEPAPVRLLSRRRWVPFAAAAGLIGLIGGIAIGVASTAGPPPERVVAEGALDALPGWAASGSVRVEQTADGRRSVVVDLDAPNPPGTGLREVWLLKADASGLVSIGFLDGATGRFTIPASVDLAQYPLVDVSAEPADGDPAHSGDSIVRGELHAL
ncbi:anti-sigma factor [Cryobacterium sp. TMS1-20-1]|uniref:anti-sigma factor n=1 Tax=Cryobacterium sp. TMS1-20-1 TaxID=1259223 RepID=UPI0010693652|nr:anti-sigma factor [Cryobacterium sp. TMS1-20-1]TFC79458.1 anti-sigma factor [Cryobacterium sp. TMS1-20-1]